MTRRVIAIAAVVLAFGATAAVAVALWPDRSTDTGPSVVRFEHPERAPSGRAGKPTLPAVTAPEIRTPDIRFALQPVTGTLPVSPRLKHPPAAGILFDVDTGEVLWQRRPQLQHAIASLTKMMTALMVADADRPGERVLISRKAAGVTGSATGELPRGKKVPLEPLLQALVMISANDAAVALAEHDSGSVGAFVKEMNRRAAGMGLDCTHFTTPNGLRDRGNYSCPLDLAVLARADLADRRIASIASTRYAKPAFPIKGKRLYLTNNHYFLQRGLAGLPQAQVTGLKTGFTDAAGRCYVTTARIGSHELGIVLLDSPDPIRQVPQLLRAGFQAVGAIPSDTKPTRGAAPLEP